MSSKLPMTKSEAIQKLQKYCAYQDRCHKEVRSKLLQLQVYGDELEEVIAELISDKFLDEERFAKSYARGKFTFKKWGKNRIRQELRRREVSDYCIKKGMQEIDDAQYEDTLREVLEKKSKNIRTENAFEKLQKLVNYAIGRGFEAELVWPMAKAIIPLP